MSVEFIQVAEDINEEPIELPIEEDGTLLLSTLQGQFPGSCGLKYRTESKAIRGIRLNENRLHPPSSGWENSTIYFCVFPKGELFTTLKYSSVLLLLSISRSVCSSRKQAKERR
jgi:hypothetical protein